MEWPKTGLEVQDAVNLVEEEVHEGHVPVLPDSVFCLRHMQALGYPIRIIAVKDPVFIIGFVPARSLPSWLGRLAWVILRRSVADCIFVGGQYGTLETGLRGLGFLRSVLAQGLNASRIGEVPVQVIDRESAADTIVAGATEDEAIILVDSLNCLWRMLKHGGVRRVFIIENPLLVVAVTGLEVDGALKASGQPALMMVDEDDEGCVMGGIVRNNPTADYHSAFRAILSNMLKNPLDAPLELMIKASNLIFTRNLDKQPTG